MNATPNTQSNVEQFPPSPKPLTSREVIQANVHLLIERMKGAFMGVIMVESCSR